MEKEFSIQWKGSSQARKQRKYRFNAPLHIKEKFLHAHLSKELRTKHNTRSIRLRKGDKVKVMRGEYKKKTGAVDRIDLKKSRVYVTGVDTIKKDGSKVLVPLSPSKLMVTEIVVDDKRRQEMLNRKKESRMKK